MIEINNICKIYNKGHSNEVKALNNLNLVVQEGEMLAIVGKSGSGKSTLLHVLAGVDRVDRGNIIVDNLDITKLKEKELANYRNKTCSIVLQNFALINDFSVRENIELPLLFAKYSKKERTTRIKKIVERTGIEALQKRPITKLSGGQKQRVAIARALVNDSKYILADEPTGSLDIKTGNGIFDLFREINQISSKTIIIVTHDLDLAQKCDRIIQINNGSIS